MSTEAIQKNIAIGWRLLNWRSLRDRDSSNDSRIPEILEVNDRDLNTYTNRN